MKSVYRLLATDLDGTLLDSEGRVSEENLAAIHRLSAAGIPVVPATGRTYADLPRVLTDNPDIRYILHSNGAALYDKVTGERILCAMPRAVLDAVMAVLDAFDTHLTVRAEGVSIVDAAMANEAAYVRYHVCPPHAQILRSVARLQPELRAFISVREDVEMLCIFFLTDEQLQRARRELQKIADIRVACAAPFLLEVVHVSAGKGGMLRRLADMLGIAYEHTIAVGDSENDLPLLADAGLSLAMRNACPALLAAADAVACSNDEHIIRHIEDLYF